MSKRPPAPTTSEKIDDSLIPYYSHAIKERLGVHALTQDFIDGLFAITGGGFKEEQGGNWERVRKGNEALRHLEQKAPKKDKDRLVAKVRRLERDRRELLDTHARVAGITFKWDSPALTTGEVAYLSRACDWVEISDIDDIIECITTAFPGASEVSASSSPRGAETGEGVSASPSPELSESDLATPKSVRVIEDDVIYPDDYFDEVDLSGSKDEVLDRIKFFLHAHLIAEVSKTHGGKGRKGVADWLISKLWAANGQGFKVPDEWRTVEEEAA